jgi:hypothetical protein
MKVGEPLIKPVPQDNAVMQITSDETRGAITRKTIQVIVALVLLFSVCEAAARVLVTAFNPPRGPSQFFDRKLQLATRPIPKHRSSVLFIGNSVGAFGIYSDLIAALWRKQGYDLDVRNLCTLASVMPERMYLLKAAVNAKAKPLLVVCDVDPPEYSSYWQQNSQSEKERRFRNSLIGIESEAAQSQSAPIDAGFSHSCCLYAYRGFLQTFLLGLPGMLMPHERNQGGMLINDRAFQGIDEASPSISKFGWCANPTVDDQFQLEKMARQRAREWSRQTGHDNPAWFNLAAVQPLIDYCADKKIPLVFLFHPQYPQSEAEKKDFAAQHLVSDEQLSTRLQAALASIPNTYLLDLRDAQTNSLDFADLVHQNAGGAVEESELIAKKLLQPPFKPLLEQGRQRKHTGEHEF